MSYIASILLRLVVFAYLLGIVLWTLPGPPENMKIGIQDISRADKIRNFPALVLYWNKVYVQQSKLRDVLRVTGTQQNWNMFAPNPVREDTWIDAIIELKDGHEVYYLYPRGSQMGLVDKFIRERFRKYIESVHLDANSFLWPPLANYIARQQFNQDPTNPPVFVTLTRHVRPVLPPGYEQPKDFDSAVFFETPISRDKL